MGKRFGPGFQGHPRKKKLFIAALIAGKNLTQAREEVGIAHNTAWRWAQEPEIRDKVEKGLSDAAVYAGVSRAWVISKLKEVADRCMQSQPVLDKLGRETGLYVFDSRGANRALELIGKHLRVFGDDAGAVAQLGAAVITTLAKEAQAERQRKRQALMTTVQNAEVIGDGKSGGAEAGEVDRGSGGDGAGGVQGGEPGPVAGGVSESVSAPAEAGGDRVQGPG